MKACFLMGNKDNLDCQLCGVDRLTNATSRQAVMGRQQTVTPRHCYKFNRPTAFGQQKTVIQIKTAPEGATFDYLLFNYFLSEAERVRNPG